MDHPFASPNPWMVLPFVVLLGTIALAPLLCPDWWSRHYPKVALSLGATTLAYYLFVLRARWEGEPAAGTTCQMLTQFQDAAGRVLPDSLRSYSFHCTGEWRAFSLETRAAPAETVTLVARVDALGQPKTGHQAYFDALQVFEIAGVGE